MKRWYDGDSGAYHQVKDDRRWFAPYNGERRARARQDENLRLLFDRIPNPGTRDGQIRMGWRAAQYAHWRAQEAGWSLNKTPHPYQVEFADLGDERRPRAVRFYAEEVVAGVGRDLICAITIPHWDHVPTMTEEHDDAAAGPA